MNRPPEIRPLQLRERLAFLIYNEDLLHHYLPVLRWLDPSQTDLIIYSLYNQPERQALAARLSRLPFQWYWGEELVQSLTGYRWLVSNYNYGSEELILPLPDGGSVTYRGYLPRMLGLYNIRFMYSLGVDAWNLADWNIIYDAYLCFGPHQRRQIEAKGFRGKAVEMGYPRYDSFFNQQPFDPEPWRRHFGCDPDKPILIWFSTLPEYFSTIGYYAQAISALSDRYNVLVKPHPASWERIPQQQEFLAYLPFTAVIQENIDNLVLYRLADYVLSDYGGTAYSALYTDKPLVLLDHPKHWGRATERLEDSETDIWLRRHIRHLGPETISSLPELLTDKAYWQAQQATRAWLRDIFFTPNYGQGGQTAARWLNYPEQLIEGVRLI